MCREMGLLQAKRVWDHAFPHAAHAYLALVPHLPSTACYMAVEHGRVDVEGKMVDWGLLRGMHTHNAVCIVYISRHTPQTTPPPPTRSPKRSQGG